MPRTPAPLTVRQGDVTGHWHVWKDRQGIVATFYEQEADARAFVALPALLNDAAILVEIAERVSDTDGLTDRQLLAVNTFRVALAQADGPAPKE